MWVKGHSRSLEMAPFKSFGTVFYLPSIITMAVPCIVLEIKRDIGQKSRFFHTQSSHVYQECTNRVPTVYQKQSKDSQNSKNHRCCTNRHMSIQSPPNT